MVLSIFNPLVKNIYLFQKMLQIFHGHIAPFIEVGDEVVNQFGLAYLLSLLVAVGLQPTA